MAIRGAEPFADQPFGDDVTDRLVSFTDAPFVPPSEMPLTNTRGDTATFRFDDADAFSVTRTIAGRNGAPGGMLERWHGAQLTTRSWTTIERILAREAG